jgi:hypothetical protein
MLAKIANWSLVACVSLLGTFRYFDRLGRTFREWPALLDKLLDDHVDDLVDVLQRLFPGLAPR